MLLFWNLHLKGRTLKSVAHRHRTKLKNISYQGCCVLGQAHFHHLNTPLTSTHHFPFLSHRSSLGGFMSLPSGDTSPAASISLAVLRSFPASGTVFLHTLHSGWMLKKHVLALRHAGQHGPALLLCRLVCPRLSSQDSRADHLGPLKSKRANQQANRKSMSQSGH